MSIRTRLGLILVTLCAAYADTEPFPSRRVEVPDTIVDLAWDQTRSRFLALAGSSVHIVDPEAASVEATIALGEPAIRLGISDDGQYLFIAMPLRNAIKRYRFAERTLDGEISLGQSSGGPPRLPAAIASLPGQPGAVLVSTLAGEVLACDSGGPRGNPLALRISSFYAPPGVNTIYAYGSGQMHWLSVDSRGVTVTRTAPAPMYPEGELQWSGRFATDRYGNVFDLDAGVLLGRPSYGSNVLYSGPAVVDPSGSSLLIVPGEIHDRAMAVYSTASFRLIGRSPLPPSQYDDFRGALARTWGADGIVIAGNTRINFFHLRDVSPVLPPPEPTPSVDASGIIHVRLPTRGLVYDEQRNLIWAATPGSVDGYGNSVVGIDPSSGRVVQTIEAGSDPTRLAMSGDRSRIYALLRGANGVATLDVAGSRRSGTIYADAGWSPASIAGIPGRPDSVAIAFLERAHEESSRIAVYDAGAARPKVLSGSISFAEGSLPLLSAVYPGDAENSLYAANLPFHNESGSHEVARLVVDADGVHLDGRLAYVRLGPSDFGGEIVYSDGALFTCGGEIRSADARILRGTFSLEYYRQGVGSPIPFPERGQLVFAGYSEVTRGAALTLIEIATLRPLAALPISGVVAASRAGPSAVAISTGAELVIVPLASLPALPTPSPSLRRISEGVQSVDLPVSAIAGVPNSPDLLLALPGKAGSLGNSIALLDPAAGRLTRSGFVGSEPSMLRVTRDGAAAYAFLAGERRVARFNIGAGARDFAFIPDPTGGSTQYPLVDLAVGPDEAVTASYYGGWLATFDRGVLRPAVDKNTQGPGAFSGASYNIAVSTDGTKVYAHDFLYTGGDFKRQAILPDGIHYLSGAASLVAGDMYSGGDLLFTDRGDVIDPERSRVVGRLPVFATIQPVIVAPDVAGGRVYAITGNRLMVFETSTYSMIAAMNVGPDGLSPKSLVRFGSDGLAFHTAEGQLWLLRISSISPLAEPITMPQPALPVTPGVTVVDLAVGDLVYDPARDRIRAGTPNSEAANGDRIVAIHPTDGALSEWTAASSNPGVLALSSDQSRLFFSGGSAGLAFYTGFSPVSETIHQMTVESGKIGPGFPNYADDGTISHRTLDLAALPGQPGTIALSDALTITDQGRIITKPNSLRIYDDGVPRPKALPAEVFSCNYLAAGVDASRLYCSDGYAIARLAVDSQGVTMRDRIDMLPASGAFGRIVYHEGRIYTTSGNVVDVEAGRVVAQVPPRGPVAVDGDSVYWLLPSSGSKTEATLLTYDRSTLQPTGSKKINVSANDFTRLITCGRGRLAFRAGKEIYIVAP